MSATSKRVALFAPSVRGGGAERVMLQLAEGLVQRGVVVNLLLAQAEGAYLDQIPRGVVLHDLKAKRVMASLPGAVRYLRRFKPDVMLSFMTHVNLVALWARRWAGVKTRLAISEHNMLSLSDQGGDAFKYRLLPFLARRFYPWADDVIAVSEGVANDVASVAGLPAGRVRVIHNPVVTPKLMALAEEPLDHPWFAQHRVPVLLGVGRLEPQKDFRTLLRAFARLREARELRLLLLGEGALRDELEQMAVELGISEDVSMPGFAGNPYRYMRHADVFVLSSAWEGLPGVLIEAMACGCAVVSTDCPSGPREILRNGAYGKLVPVGDAEALAVAIGETLDNPASSARVVERARDFSQEVIVDRYIDRLFGLESQ